MTSKETERNPGRGDPGAAAGERKASVDLSGTENLPNWLNADLGPGKTAELGKQGRSISESLCTAQQPEPFHGVTKTP